MAGVTATLVLEKVCLEVGCAGMRKEHHHRDRHHPLRTLRRCSSHSFWEVIGTWNRCSKTWMLPLLNIADNTRCGDNPGGQEVNRYSSFKDFMDTKLPVFKEATELLKADEWINTME